MKTKLGWQLLLADLDKIEKRFNSKTFKGEFHMGYFGKHGFTEDHKPEEKNHCGTSACLGGWMAIVSLPKTEMRWLATADGYSSLRLANESEFETFASRRYANGMYGGYTLFHNLFYNGVELKGKAAFKLKMAEARAVAVYLKAVQTATATPADVTKAKEALIKARKKTFKANQKVTSDSSVYIDINNDGF